MTAAAAQQDLSNKWWLFLIEGIALIILGALFLTSPGLTLASLVFFLGVYWLVTGIIAIVQIFTKSTDTHWGWLLAKGILGIIAGIFVIRNFPVASTILVSVTFILVLGINGIIMGVIGLVEAFRGGGWGPGILGVINILFGIILLANPVLAASALPWVLGILALIGGIVVIVFAFRVK